MNSRSEKKLLALLAICGGVGIGLLLVPNSRDAVCRVAGDWAKVLERRLGEQLEGASDRLSAEAARLMADIVAEIVPQFEEPGDGWKDLYRELVRELEHRPYG